MLKKLLIFASLTLILMVIARVLIIDDKPLFPSESDQTEITKPIKLRTATLRPTSPYFKPVQPKLIRKERTKLAVTISLL